MAASASFEQLQEVQRKMSERIEVMEEKVDAMFLACTKLFGDAVPHQLKVIAEKIEVDSAKNSGEVVMKEKKVQFTSLIPI